MRAHNNKSDKYAKKKYQISNLINKSNIIDYDVKMSSYRNKDNVVKGFWVKRSITLKPLESMFVILNEVEFNLLKKREAKGKFFVSMV